MNLQAAVSLLTVFLLSSFSAGSPACAENAPRDLAGERAVKKWTKEFSKIDSLVLEGRHEKALRRGDRLMHEMIKTISGGSESRRLVGSVYLLRGLAAYGVGDQDQAIWNWQIGLQIFPEILEQMNIERYGEAGRFLATFSEPRKASYDAADLPDSGVLPKKTSGDMPRIPRSRYADLQDALTVRLTFVIGQDGTPRDPVILLGDSEFTMTCVTLEKMRTWRFEPGTVNGEPVDMAYTLTTKYSTVIDEDRPTLPVIPL